MGQIAGGLAIFGHIGRYNNEGHRKSIIRATPGYPAMHTNNS